MLEKPKVQVRMDNQETQACTNKQKTNKNKNKNKKTNK
jgi:hypothetical protein